MKTEKNFNFWVPLEISKGKDKKGEEVMRIGGIASTGHEDSDEETLETAGFDVKPLLKSGFLNYHHMQKSDPSAIIGEPTKAEITKKGLYIEGTLYKDSPMAKKVYELAQLLEKSSSTRRLGFSIEGKATERDPMNPKRIIKASITGCAVTFSPKNSHTLAEIIKGDVESEPLEYDYTEELIDGNKTKIIADITKADGTRILIDSEGKFTYQEKEIEKAKGEGSKGGKVIGHTKSGKPIYESHHSPSEAYGKFDKKDHLDAVKHHDDRTQVDHSDYKNEKDEKKVNKEIKKHKQSRDWHQGEADNFVDNTEKAMDTSDTGKALKKEHVDGEVKDQLSAKVKKVLSKAETIERISTDFSGIKSEDTEKVFKIISKISQNMKTEITSETIEKAYAILGIAGEEKTDSIEKAKDEPNGDEAEAKGKKVEKADDEGEKDEKGEKKDMKKAEDDKKKEDEEVKKAKEAKDKEDMEKAEEEEKKKKEMAGKEVKKAEDNDIQKAMTDMIAKQTDMFGAIGTILKGQKEQFNSFQKSIEDRFDALENSSPGKKSITKARAQERFGNEDNDIQKSENNTFSISKQKGKVLQILEKATFEKGCDDQFAKAMTTFESSSYMDPNVAKRLLLEKGINLVQ